MGFFKDIKEGLVKLIGDDPKQYVNDENKLDNELKICMNASGSAKILPADAALLSGKVKEMDEKADILDKAQINSVVIHVSDMAIRARNRIEKFFKERNVNKKLLSKLEQNSALKGDLPKDDTVKKAESTNGKIKTVAAGELENNPREQGGRERNSRIK